MINMLDNDDIRNILFLGIKYAAIAFMILHFLTTIIGWRQVFVMNQQIQTRSGAILLLINFLNILFVLATILLTVLFLGTELP